MNTPYKLQSAKILLSCFAFAAIALIASCKKDSDDSVVIQPDNNDGQLGNGGNDQDGNPFTSVIIGSQEWMNKNLSVATYTDGTPIPQVTDPNVWVSLTTGAWCWYDNNGAAYGAAYGRLYNWYAVAGIYNAESLANPALRKQLAPTGWHVPSYEEWNEITNYLGGANVAGGKMKTTGNIEDATGLWRFPNTGANNSSSFSGVPGGYCDQSGWFGTIGHSGSWWSKTEDTANNPWFFDLSYGDSYAARLQVDKRYGFSVRCLRD